MTDAESEPEDQQESRGAYGIFSVRKNNIPRYVYFISIIAALNGVILGFDTGVISGALLYIKQSFSLSPFQQGLVVSGVLIGALVGSAIGGELSDRIGRRRLVAITAGIFFGSSLWMALAPSLFWLISGRIVAGLSIGVASIIGSLYISEIAPPANRGALVSLNQLAITCGILLAYVVDSIFAGNGGWRWMLGFGVVPAVILGVGVIALPESPRWLVTTGQEDKARNVLARLRPQSNVDTEMREIKEIESREEMGWSELFEPWMRSALIAGAGLAFFAQITGINTIIYYAPTVLHLIGLGNSASILATTGLGIVNVVMTIIAIIIVDRVGRRPMLISGFCLTAVSFTGLGIAFSLPLQATVTPWLAIGSMVLFIISFAIGIGPMFRLIISEIYPLRIRGAADGVTNVIHWIVNIGVSLSFPVLLQTIGQSITYWAFAAASVVGVFFMYVYIPETKERSLEEIEADLRGISVEETVTQQSEVPSEERSS